MEAAKSKGLPTGWTASRNKGGRRGHVDQHAAIFATGLEQKDADTGLLGQPVGEYATGRTGADDDVVVGFGIRHKRQV